MASIGLWCPWSLQRPLSHFTFVSKNNNGSPKLGKQQWVVRCCKNNEQQQCFQNRREILVGMTMSVVGFSFNSILSDALAETEVAEDFRIYTDDVNKFKISVPKGWLVAAGEPDGFKSVTAFYPEGNTSSNVSVVITGLGPDFTKIESFGKVDEFAETLVSGLDRSWQRPPGVAAKLINSKSSNVVTDVSITSSTPCKDQGRLADTCSQRLEWHLMFEEADLDNYGSQIQQAVKSFRFI
ncbi:hypothetical protein F8388_012543 [Cannabis sativa]|uniref:PsbP C-terminal domain-containing protein n=1 Tax=Cannabis sativa TaxID=3483 RepID=A0A7J6H043_CANSA|nr:hypothetical protein F8388_012543 [Cannabis sativa]